MSTKIFVMTHRKFDVPKDTMYVPIQVGKAGKEDLGYTGDDTGDNISAKNCYYGELTGLYWAAKNVSDADYMGLCHYRRFFQTPEGNLLTESQCENILQEYDVILPTAVYHSKSYYEMYKEAHNIYDLDVTGEVIKELYPGDYEVFKDVVGNNKEYNGNLFITSKERFKEYANWLFSIFDLVEQRISVEDYDSYHRRVFGFISEQLLYVWVKSRGLKVKEIPIGMSQEKAETIELKQKIKEIVSGGTLQDVQKALTLFRETMKSRPDVMLPASDLSGELADMFRILYICEQELIQGQAGMLYISKDINVLLKHYHLIETILLHLLTGTVSQEEVDYFGDARVSLHMLKIIINNNPVLKKEEDKIFSFFE